MVRINKITSLLCAALLLSAAGVLAQSTPAPSGSSSTPNATHKPPAPNATHKVPATTTPAPAAGTNSGVSSAHQQ